MIQQLYKSLSAHHGKRHHHLSPHKVISSFFLKVTSMLLWGENLWSLDLRENKKFRKLSKIIYPITQKSNMNNINKNTSTNNTTMVYSKSQKQNRWNSETMIISLRYFLTPVILLNTFAGQDLLRWFIIILIRRCHEVSSGFPLEWWLECYPTASVVSDIKQGLNYKYWSWLPKKRQNPNFSGFYARSSNVY